MPGAEGPAPQLMRTASGPMLRPQYPKSCLGWGCSPGLTSLILAAYEGSRQRGVASPHVAVLYGFYYLEQQPSLVALGQ